MSYVTPDEIALARRVCRRASDLGYKIREIVIPFGSRFEWLLPNGLNVSGLITGERQIALVGACRELAIRCPAITSAA